MTCWYVSDMSDSSPVRAIAEAVTAYREHANVAVLHEQLAAVDGAPHELAAAVESYRDIPEVVGPIYERIVTAEPSNARALVVLASAYWMHGRGPEVVGELASRAMAADPENRGAWHLWALTESNPRARVGRWQQVSRRFPEDDLARANLADNAASLAGAEQDPVALGLAIETYEALRARATMPDQRSALDTAISTLKGWRW
jgi:hypothetical protein